MKKIYLFAIALVALFESKAQDLHFSQYFTNQVWLNPALTGNIQQDYSVSGIYRTQWNAIDAKFENMAFSADFKIPAGNNFVGLGASFVKDNLPQARFGVNSIMFNGAYHYYIDYTKRHVISGGLALGWTAKSFLPGAGLEFGNQYSNYKFDPTIASNEDLQNQTINSLNSNIGVNYKFRLNARTNLKAGLNLNSVTTPNESFVSDKNTNQLGARLISYASADYELNPQIMLTPKFLYTQQSKGNDVTIGGLATYKINKTSYLQGGAFYRIKDSGILMAGFGWQSILIRGSIDMTTSSLTDVSKIPNSGYKSPRAYEIGFIYSGVFRNHQNTNLTVPCGIF
jgi:type IX secretion system PorP/SprF family membrane protein